MGGGCFQLPQVRGRVPRPPVLAPPALAPRVLLALRLCFFFRRARVRPEEQVRPSWLEVKRLPVVVAHAPRVRATISRPRIVRTARSEERRVGQACVHTCRYRWSPDNKK